MGSTLFLALSADIELVSAVHSKHNKYCITEALEEIFSHLSSFLMNGK
jgi:hypothetical protein